MKRLILLFTLLAIASVSAQPPPPNPIKMKMSGSESIATLLGMITPGTSVELHLRSGEKMAGILVESRPAAVGAAAAVGPVVRLTKLTGAEFYDGFVNVADISAIVLRGLPPVKMP